jgi:hypothetical protein
MVLQRPNRSLYFAWNRTDIWLPSNETAGSIDRFMHYTVYDLVELDYSVMAHAQETICIYGRNGRIHVLLQQIWEGRQFNSLLASGSCVGGHRSGLIPLCCFHLISPLSPRFVASHSNRAVTTIQREWKEMGWGKGISYTKVRRRLYETSSDFKVTHKFCLSFVLGDEGY